MALLRNLNDFMCLVLEADWVPTTNDNSSEIEHGKASRWDVWEELLQTEGTKRLPEELRKIFRYVTGLH